MVEIWPTRGVAVAGMGLGEGPEKPGMPPEKEGKRFVMVAGGMRG